LQTPLNAVLGFSEMLADPRLQPREAIKQREYARIIHSSAQHLLSIVNLVLDMSRIEGGKFEILREKFDVGQLIAACCDMLSLKAEVAGVELVRPSQVNLELVADKRACRQILLNLMSNAVKFTPAGGKVFVTAEIVRDACHLCVADNGIGIPEDHLPRLGDPYYQVGSSGDFGNEGMGLGLALVRGLVGLHGGTLLVESVAGEGTRITVRLPMDYQTLVQLPAGSPRLETAARFDPTQASERLLKRRDRRKAPESGEKKIA
jgi:two-component system, cell cycle sensor histidine kinase DivJ